MNTLLLVSSSHALWFPDALCFKFQPLAFDTDVMFLCYHLVPCVYDNICRIERKIVENIFSFGSLMFRLNVSIMWVYSIFWCKWMHYCTCFLSSSVTRLGRWFVMLCYVLICQRFVYDMKLWTCIQVDLGGVDFLPIAWLYCFPQRVLFYFLPSEATYMHICNWMV